VKANLPNRIDPFVNGTPKSAGKAAANGRHGTNGKPHPPAEGAEAAPPAAPSRTDRGADGQFQLGCRPGPGNPFAKRVASLRKALLDSVSEADVAQVGQKLVRLALAGDVPAAKVFLSYVVGKPTAPVDPDRVELEAWKLLLSWPTVAEALAAAWAVRPAAAAELVESGAPTTAAEVIEKGASQGPLEGAVRVIRRREEKGR
jgi:hypothetical protein